jgi:hypothetical protein
VVVWWGCPQRGGPWWPAPQTPQPAGPAGQAGNSALVLTVACESSLPTISAFVQNTDLQDSKLFKAILAASVVYVLL